LKTLILQNSDVDDYECENFITSIKANSTLTEIDLSNNKIGSAEALNVVRPDLITGMYIYIYIYIYIFMYIYIYKICICIRLYGYIEI
jgi:hypothetical protein